MIRSTHAEALALCEHHECQCLVATKLATVGRTLEAIDVHFSKVRCTKGDPQRWQR